MVVSGAGEAAAKVAQPWECFDEDTFIPLCTNESGHASCHYGNIGSALRWQQNALKEGLANYAEGDSHKLLRVACYLAAYARKLERGGYGYAAATNAYGAISWLQRSASRGCDEARAACYCCLGFGGSIVRHGKRRGLSPQIRHAPRYMEQNQQLLWRKPTVTLAQTNSYFGAN